MLQTLKFFRIHQTLILDTLQFCNYFGYDFFNLLGYYVLKLGALDTFLVGLLARSGAVRKVESGIEFWPEKEAGPVKIRPEEMTQRRPDSKTATLLLSIPLS